MVREDTWAPSEGATCAWMATDEAVGCTRAFLTMWHSSRRLVCRGIDEAHFWLNGYVNKQNCRIWSEANPHVYVETPLHPEKLTVWCALWAGGIIGPYFFKNDEGQIGLHPSQPWQSYARNHI
ncbi:uncharacterized protein TNCV_1742181 [Trichonephila clavipes]|nr:uncharacterized protein TNCV_1742181 [Trichonephila clavipes]